MSFRRISHSDVWNLNAKGNLTYEKNLVDRLKQHFSNQGQAETYKAQLYRHRQKSTETLNDLLFEMLRNSTP